MIGRVVEQAVDLANEELAELLDELMRSEMLPAYSRQFCSWMFTCRRGAGSRGQDDAMKAWRKEEGEQAEAVREGVKKTLRESRKAATPLVIPSRVPDEWREMKRPDSIELKFKI